MVRREEAAQDVRDRFIAIQNDPGVSELAASFPDLDSKVTALNALGQEYVGAFSKMESAIAQLNQSMSDVLASADQSAAKVEEMVAAAQASISFEEARIAGVVGEALALTFRDNANYLLTEDAAVREAADARMAESLKQIDALCAGGHAV